MNSVTHQTEQENSATRDTERKRERERERELLHFLRRPLYEARASLTASCRLSSSSSGSSSAAAGCRALSSALLPTPADAAAARLLLRLLFLLAWHPSAARGDMLPHGSHVCCRCSRSRSPAFFLAAGAAPAELAAAVISSASASLAFWQRIAGEMQRRSPPSSWTWKDPWLLQHEGEGDGGQSYTAALTGCVSSWGLLTARHSSHTPWAAWAPK